MFINKKVLIVVPDGVGIKNYLYSKLPKTLSESSELTIWSTLPYEAFHDLIDNQKLRFQYQQIELKPENWITRLCRESATFARLKHFAKIKNNATILSYWRPQKYSLMARSLFFLSELTGEYLTKNYDRILRIEEIGEKCISKKSMENFLHALEKIKPDTVFFTHQRVPGLAPIVKAAKLLNIQTITAIYSWDNLPKARLAIKTDKFLVWSQWMKDEMKEYYPEIQQSKVIVTGTPQFEFYTETERVVDREVFANRYNLDSKKKWICFSGDDVTTSPFDREYLKDVAQAIVPLKNEVELIFRRCPADFSDRYDKILEGYKDFVVSIDPIWNVDSRKIWSSYFPKMEDVNLQVNLAYHCDLVINLGST